MDRTRKKSVKRYFDYSLLFVTIFIAGFGLIMIYSTSSYTAQMKFGNAQYYFKKQLMFMLLGFVAMYIAYRIDYHVWHKLAFPFFIFASLLFCSYCTINVCISLASISTSFWNFISI